MKKANPVQTKLDAIKAVLKNLRPQQMPGEDQKDLQTAQLYLNEIASDIHASQDHVRLAALYRVSQMLGTSLDLEQALTQVMDAAIGLTGAERGLLVLLEPGTSNWKVSAARNFKQESLRHPQTATSFTVINSVIESNRGIVTTDAQTDPRFSEHESVVYHALRSIMCAPLLARGQVIGAIYVDNRAQVGIFTADDLAMLNALATQAAIAIENARLYTRTDQALARRVTELETLAQIDRQLNAELDTKQTVEIAHRWAVQESKATRGWILLTDTGIIDEGVFSYPQEYPDLSDALITRALADKGPQFSEPNGEVPARLVIPILHGAKLLGMLILERPQAFNQADVEFLTYMVSRAASAVRNAKLYEEVQKISEAKTTFISVVTHELRIPMTSIKGYADLLRQGVVGTINEQQVNFLDVIRNNVERMSSLVTDLSDISKIDAGRISLTCNFVPAKVYVDEVARNMRPKLEVKKQKLEVDVPGDLPQVYVDSNRFMQILGNMVNNASRYTPEGGKVRVVARRKGEFIRLDVSDNGIGISLLDQQRIFTQFFRSEDPAVRAEPGWGLGLHIAKRLVDVMGGDIGFNSTLGEGSVFWFTLPTTRKADEK